MVDPVSAGTGFAISILAASSYDYLKGVYVEHQVKQCIKTTADDVAKSYDLIINGYNPLLIALEGDETGALVDEFKDEGTAISVNDLSNVLENTLETEFDTTFQERDIDSQTVVMDFLQEYEEDIIAFDEIRDRIFLHYFREMSHNHSELLEDYLTDLEKQARRIEEQADRISDNVNKLDNSIDRLTETIDNIEDIADQSGVDEAQLTALKSDLQGLKSDRLSQDELKELISTIDIEQEVASTLTEILVLLLKYELAEAEAKTSRLQPLLEGIIPIDSTYGDSRHFIDFDSTFEDDHLLIRIQNHRANRTYVHMEIDGGGTMLIAGERTKEIKNIEVRPMEQQHLAYSVEPVTSDPLPNQQPRFNSWLSLRPLDDAEDFPTKN